MNTTGADFWPACGWQHLARDASGWLVPTDDWWRLWLARPELALVPESCRAETALHRALQREPGRVVRPAELQAVRDADARENYGHFLALRDGILAAGTLEAWTLQLFRGGSITTPPFFIALVTQAIVRTLLEGCDDALQARAAELLFRAQRITVQDSRLLAGDRDTLDLQNDTQGLGDLGRLLAEAQVPMKPATVRVLGTDNAARYWAEAAQSGTRSTFLLDLTHDIQLDLGHGLAFHMTAARSGQKALASVLQRWVRHLLGVAVRIEPVQRIDDPQWRWHLGLDAESTALLNDLYQGAEVAPERLKRVVSLFRLDFVDPAEMRRDVAGKPVYLGLMADSGQLLRLKPQNLLLNLPLAAVS